MCNRYSQAQLSTTKIRWTLIRCNNNSNRTPSSQIWWVWMAWIWEWDMELMQGWVWVKWAWILAWEWQEWAWAQWMAAWMEWAWHLIWVWAWTKWQAWEWWTRISIWLEPAWTLQWWEEWIRTKITWWTMASKLSNKTIPWLAVWEWESICKWAWRRTSSKHTLLITKTISPSQTRTAAASKRTSNNNLQEDQWQTAMSSTFGDYRRRHLKKLILK